MPSWYSPPGSLPAMLSRADLSFQATAYHSAQVSFPPHPTMCIPSLLPTSFIQQAFYAHLQRNREFCRHWGMRSVDDVSAHGLGVPEGHLSMSSPQQSLELTDGLGGCGLVGSHITLVLLVTVVLSHSFLGQPGSSLANVVRLLTFSVGVWKFPNYLDPKLSAQKTIDHTGFREGHIAPLAAQSVPQNMTETDLREMTSLPDIILHNVIKPFTGLCTQKAKSVAIP